MEQPRLGNVGRETVLKRRDAPPERKKKEKINGFNSFDIICISTSFHVAVPLRTIKKGKMISLVFCHHLDLKRGEKGCTVEFQLVVRLSRSPFCIKEFLQTKHHSHFSYLLGGT